MIPTHLKYTQEHEWALTEDDIVTIGITDHAVDELGEIVFVELPEVGTLIGQMDEFGAVESVKTLSSLFSPITGEIIEVNKDVVQSPGTINDSPYDEGWLVKIRLSEPNEIDDLMTSQEYESYLETL